MKMTQMITDARTTAQMRVIIAKKIELDALNRQAKWAEIKNSDDPRIALTLEIQDEMAKLTDEDNEILDSMMFGE
jgi:hypothetical protein